MAVGGAMSLGAQTKKPRAWTPARTPDGQPDLQGTWVDATITPFERPGQLAAKEVLSADEAAELERKAAESRVESAPRAGDVGSYNQIWVDSGTKVVKTRQASLVVDPPDGRVPVSSVAEAKRDYNLAHTADSYEYMSTWDRCITRGVPGDMFPAGYNNAYQILQAPGYVVILAEMIHDARVIPINGGAHAPAGIKGIPESDAAHIVERFTPVDPGTILYEATIEDPKAYAKPWKVAIPLSRDPEYTIYEYACHEGNYAMEDILNGGRAQEKTAQK